MIDASTLRFEDWSAALTGGEHAEAFLEESHGTSLHFEDSRLMEAAAGTDRGVGLRFLHKNGERSCETIHGALNSLDPAEARLLAGRLLNGLPRRTPPAGGPIEYHRHLVSRRPSEVPIEEKIALLEGVDRAARGVSPHVKQVSAVYAERFRRFAVLDSTGCFRLGERSVALFIVTVTAEKGAVMQTGSEVIGGLKGYELFDDFIPALAARTAAKTAVDKLDAPLAPAGEMPVVLASSAGGTFIHEAIGHSLEADHVQEGASPHYAGKLGQSVAREFLTIIDDPTLPYARGSYPFDDEGLPAKPTPVIKNGVLVDYLYDRLTALKDGRESNGHGRRESFRHKPIPRMSNLYIAPGSDDPREIVRSIKRGLLVTKMGGGQVNTATGEFVFGVDEGFLVEDGAVKHLVRDANLLGEGPEVLRSIDKLGWDIGWGIGTCGKEGQGVPVSDGQPTLRIPKVVVGGREES
ncbi:MAG: TldD/PmbA family protein [Elusimicrobia bacterium]|nr:TldD/PmbA family protein [Elusimicrobiota bacterium]